MVLWDAHDKEAHGKERKKAEIIFLTTGRVTRGRMDGSVAPCSPDEIQSEESLSMSMIYTHSLVFSSPNLELENLSATPTEINAHLFLIDR